MTGPRQTYFRQLEPADTRQGSVFCFVHVKKHPGVYPSLHRRCRLFAVDATNVVDGYSVMVLYVESQRDNGVRVSFLHFREKDVGIAPRF